MNEMPLLLRWRLDEEEGGLYLQQADAVKQLALV
jgi:hypothetical protein